MKIESNIEEVSGTTPTTGSNVAKCFACGLRSASMQAPESLVAKAAGEELRFFRGSCTPRPSRRGFKCSHNQMGTYAVPDVSDVRNSRPHSLHRNWRMSRRSGETPGISRTERGGREEERRGGEERKRKRRRGRETTRGRGRKMDAEEEPGRRKREVENRSQEARREEPRQRQIRFLGLRDQKPSV